MNRRSITGRHCRTATHGNLPVPIIPACPHTTQTHGPSMELLPAPPGGVRAPNSVPNTWYQGPCILPTPFTSLRLRSLTVTQNGHDRKSVGHGMLATIPVHETSSNAAMSGGQPATARGHGLRTLRRHLLPAQVAGAPPVRLLASSPGQPLAMAVYLNCKRVQVQHTPAHRCGRYSFRVRWSGLRTFLQKQSSHPPLDFARLCAQVRHNPSVHVRRTATAHTRMQLHPCRASLL